NSSAQVHAEEIFQEPTPLPPGAPPAFGAGPAVGPEVSPATFAAAEKLVQVNLTPADRARAAESWRVNLASLYERRTGPRTIALEPTLAPFSRYHSVLPSQSGGPRRDLALAQAKRADEEIAAGKYRGPLHGIPWGGKDLLDTAGIPTTYGAEPFRNRVPKEDAAVVKRLHAAGAVLLAKLSLGALALN